jgi:Baseplate J-like protein
MQTVDEQPETIHLYVVREKEPKPSVFPIVLSALSLIVLLVFCVLAPYQQPVTLAVIRVPAVLLPIRTFTATVAVIPTGVKVYPATTAHGVLTITNGSVIAQTIPQGFRLGNVITYSPVFVPAGSANGYGYATVAAQALISGKAGNIPAYAINLVEGSSVYIRNLVAFRGGADSYAVTVVTSQDRQTALEKARSVLTTLSLGLHYPCKEYVNIGNSYANISVIWRCQFVTYHLPAMYHVTAISIIGKNLLIHVWFVPRPIRYWVK